jgi:hypothetical protein
MLLIINNLSFIISKTLLHPTTTVKGLACLFDLEDKSLSIHLQSKMIIFTKLKKSQKKKKSLSIWLSSSPIV